MSGVLSGACLGIIWGMSGASFGACLEASSGACLGHHLGRVWGIIWGISGALSGACLGHHHIWYVRCFELDICSIGCKRFLFSFLQASLGFPVYRLLLPGLSPQIDLFSCKYKAACIVTWQQEILHEAEGCKFHMGKDKYIYKTCKHNAHFKWCT